MDSFKNIEPFGNIYMDKVLFETYEPILFTCKDTNNHLFLAVCCTSNNIMKKWLITYVDLKCLIELLTDQITIREAFLFETEHKYTVILENEKCTCIKNDLQDWATQSSFLPSAGEYMDAEDSEFEEELQYFTLMESQKDESVMDYIGISEKIDFECLIGTETENWAGSLDLLQIENIEPDKTMYTICEIDISIAESSDATLNRTYESPQNVNTFRLNVNKQSKEYSGEYLGLTA